MTDEFERKVRDAVASEGAGVQPTDGSLAVIRQRVAMARRRRVVGGTALGAAAALVIGIAIGVGVGGDDTTDVAAGGGGSTTTTTPCPTTSTVPGTATTQPPSSTTYAPGSSSTTSTVTTVRFGPTSTTVPVTTVPPSAPGSIEEIIHEAEVIAEANCGAPTTGTTTTAPATTTSILTAEAEPSLFPVGLPLAPDQEPPVEWRTPEGIAQAYLDHIRVQGAELSGYDSLREQIVAYRPAPGGTGEAEPRSVLTVVPGKTVCAFDGTCYETWVVREARSPAIVLERAEVQQPADGQSNWTLELEGRARGFEGTISVRVAARGDVGWAADGFITASGGEELLPFSTAIDLGRPPVGEATLLLSNEGGEDGGPWEFTALPIRIAVP